MSCRWGYEDCQSPSECIYCVSDGLRYTPPKKRYKLKVNNQKADGRQGSNFEYANHKRNEEMLAKSRMTINSGATAKEKGDEQISGIINVMEELKTQEPERGKGCKSFAIKRHWLNKLHVEALKENKAIDTKAFYELPQIDSEFAKFIISKYTVDVSKYEFAVKTFLELIDAFNQKLFENVYPYLSDEIKTSFENGNFHGR